MGMFGRIAIEILLLRVCYAAYMAVLVHKRGPMGGIFFYPQGMIDRVKALGLITEAEFLKRKRFAFILLIAWMLVISGVMILWINGAAMASGCCSGGSCCTCTDTSWSIFWCRTSIS